MITSEAIFIKFIVVIILAMTVYGIVTAFKKWMDWMSRKEREMNT